MKRSAVFVALLGAALVSIGGCKKPDPLSGKWTVSTAGMPQGLEVTMEFTPPDRAVMAGKQTTPQNVVVNLHIEATYKLEGDKLTIDVTTVKLTLDPATMAKIPENIKAMAQQQLAAGETKTLEEAKKDPTGTIKWEGADKFTATDAKGKTDTYTRVK